MMAWNDEENVHRDIVLWRCEWIFLEREIFKHYNAALTFDHYHKTFPDSLKLVSKPSVDSLKQISFGSLATEVMVWSLHRTGCSHKSNKVEKIYNSDLFIIEKFQAVYFLVRIASCFSCTKPSFCCKVFMIFENSMSR